jgi:hypothetical protein
LFVEAALQVILALARNRVFFTSDEVWRFLITNPLVEPRAMGAAFEKARRSGAIQRTDQTSKSQRPQCHSRPLRVWNSKIYRVKK